MREQDHETINISELEILENNVLGRNRMVSFYCIKGKPPINVPKFL